MFNRTHLVTSLLGVIGIALLAGGIMNADDDPPRGRPRPLPADEESDLPNIDGRYSSAGTNPDGSTYRSEWTVEIERTGETYQFTWTKPGSEPWPGIGILQDGKLSVGYDQAEDLPAVIVYTIGDEVQSRAGTRHVLTGVWTVVGQEAIGTETLTPIR